MSQRRSYPNSGDFNLDDLFRPEPGQQPQPPQGQPVQPGPHGQPLPPGAPTGQPEYLGEGIPAQGGPYGGQPAADPAPATQYLPPYPGGAPQQGYQDQSHAYPTQAMPQQAAPSPGYPPQPQQQAYPAYQPPAQEYPQAQEYPPAEEYPGTQAPTRQGGGRSSGKLVIGGVVAGCVAAGILVAVLMSGDDEEPGNGKQAAPVATGATTGAAPTASGSVASAVSPEAKAQAQALSDLLGTANDSRQAVIGAVGSVQKCDKLPESQQALTEAAGKRRDLQAKLAKLKADQLPSGQQLVDQLNQAWQASATADDEYAAWAGDSQAGCDPKKLDNQHYKNAVQASGTATTAKKQAAGLWNAVAGQTGLPTRTDGDL